MAKVYLETSFFSACVSTKPSAKSKGWRASSLEWWNQRASNHELFISEEVIRELSDPIFPNRAEALKMVDRLSLLEVGAEVRQLAELLVKERVMPGPSLSGDAIHVATAAYNEMQYLLTWNVKHLANENKRTHLAVISMRLGFLPPTIVTPDML